MTGSDMAQRDSAPWDFPSSDRARGATDYRGVIYKLVGPAADILCR
jgi:hypothetical protein